MRKFAQPFGNQAAVREKPLPTVRFFRSLFCLALMRVTLFIPCFIDALYPEVGVGMVKVLERLGHAILYPEGPTCCGQPPFNSGYWAEARTVAARQLEVFHDAEVVVSASGSCG